MHPFNPCSAGLIRISSPLTEIFAPIAVNACFMDSILSVSLTRNSPAPFIRVSPSAKDAATISTGISSMTDGIFSLGTVMPFKAPEFTVISHRSSQPLKRRLSTRISAFIPFRSSMKPNLVRFDKTSFITSFEPSSISAATAKKAALDISPGIDKDLDLNSGRGKTVTVSSSISSFAPKRLSILSVWSRERMGSVISVTPSAYNPAKMAADFTWALGSLLLYLMAFSPPPFIISGANLSSLAFISAPMSLSGSMTLYMGLLDSDSSPVSVVSKSWPASIPEISLIDVPEFPRYMSPRGFLSPLRPTPSTATSPAETSMRTPSSRNAFTVERQSSLMGKFAILDLPRAIDAIMTARWEMDLSPFKKRAPSNLLKGLMVISLIGPF